MRLEIEGLRAVAILLVLIVHAGAPVFLGGFVGVDIFFVISGFLITSHILREVERSGRLNLLNFWGRRMKRLLPAALTVFIVTAIAVWALVPNTSWRAMGSDIAAAALYIVNWRFAATAVDYNAEGAGVSPVLHFWSLSVEEQFYIIWPVLFALAAWIFIRKLGIKRIRLIAGIVILLVAVPSLIWSIHYTKVSPDAAYFVTTTRLWELAVGAAVAIGVPLWPKLPSWFAHLIGWAGAVAVAIAAIFYTEEMPWPGYIALLPVLGAAAVIVSTTGRRLSWAGPGKILALKPMVWVGGLSYSWYLWHWPVLTIAQAHWGPLRLRYKILLVLFAGVLAWLSLKLIENPVRRAKTFADSPKLTLSFGINLSFLGVLAGVIVVLLVPSSGGTVSTAQAATIGAHQLKLRDDGTVEPYEAQKAVSQTFPAPAEATTDLPQAQDDGCVVKTSSAEVKVCDYGAADGELDVALVGDSKILQWQPAISAIGERNGWRVHTYLKSACAFTSPDYKLIDEQRTNCAGWNNSVISKLLEAHPDVVITTGRGVFGGVDDSGDISAGAEMIAKRWTQLQQSGIRVVPLLDNPAPPQEIYECVAKNMGDLDNCAFEKEPAVEGSGARFQRAAADLSGVRDLVDVSDITCPDEHICPAVIGDVLLYRQGSHLTDTFIRSTVDVLEPRLVSAVTGADQ